MDGYRFSPQFANLTGLQPVQPIDVTRGGDLQFQALAPIQVLSTQPELVAQGIAGAAQGIAQGALKGITAKWEKEEAREAEARKYEHELELAGAKKKSEDLDFAQKELLKFDIAHSGDADYPERRKQVEEALYGRVRDVTPQKEPSESVKKAQEESEKEYKTSEDARYKKALEEAKAGDLKQQIQKVDAETPLPEMPDQPTAPLAEVKPISQKEEKPAPLAKVKLPVDETTSASTKAAETTSPAPPKVDVVPLPQPDYPAGRFESREQAEEARKTIDTNKHWEFKVSDKPDSRGYFYIEPIDKFETVTNRQRQERDDWYKQQDLELKKQKAQQETQKSAQEMQIRQQKVKDENKVLADHVETAATSLRDIDDIISTIDNNPWSVGRLSSSIAAIPVPTDAFKVREKFDSLKSNITINALNAMRNASPTGAAVGNVSNQENEMFSKTEGPLNPSLEKKDILPVLREIQRKRLKIYNDSVEILKANNPGYTPPPIKYPKEEKKLSKSKSSEEQITQSIPIVKSKSDYDKLPIGSKYIFNGVEHTKTKK